MAKKKQQLKKIKYIIVQKLLKKYGLEKDYQELIFGFDTPESEKMNGTCLMTFKSFENAK